MQILENIDIFTLMGPYKMYTCTTTSFRSLWVLIFSFCFPSFHILDYTSMLNTNYKHYVLLKSILFNLGWAQNFGKIKIPMSTFLLFLSIFYSKNAFSSTCCYFYTFLLIILSLNYSFEMESFTNFQILCWFPLTFDF